mmetsp:Transcript_30490/g.39112  ORF Transcript_30490/g.39112 Transcript_30490/m.39112 type:complete len:149 (-) Transcript_30490:46-492(-)
MFLFIGSFENEKGICVPMLPLVTIVLALIADVCISILGLYLFYQPFRLLKQYSMNEDLPPDVENVLKSNFCAAFISTSMSVCIMLSGCTFLQSHNVLAEVILPLSILEIAIICVSLSVAYQDFQALQYYASKNLCRFFGAVPVHPAPC